MPIMQCSWNELASCSLLSIHLNRDWSATVNVLVNTERSSEQIRVFCCAVEKNLVVHSHH